MLSAGTLKFGPNIKVTDPCYDDSNDCCYENLTIKPGEYICAYNTADRFGVSMCGIYNAEIFKNLEDIENLHNQINDGFDCIGTICVDAGLAGFFENKPDFTNDEWSHLCNLTFSNETDSDFKVIDNCAYIKNGNDYKGFFTSSGEGDGDYHVYVKRNKDGEIIAAYINFYH